MRRHALALPLLLAALLAAPAAIAQDATARDDDQIVVTGKKEKPVKEAQRFIRQVIPMSNGQLARFVEPICPAVLGLPQAKVDAIIDRLRRVAAEAKVPVAPFACEPNLMVVFAADADGLIGMMRKRHSVFFDDLSDVDLRDAFRSGPVHAWRLIEERDEDGRPKTELSDANNVTVFSQPTQTASVNAVVVFDRSVVLDKTIAQIADYVAMRALAGAYPPRDGIAGGDTILSLFDPELAARPVGLTDMDRRLLTGLYAIDGTGTATGQAGRISREMAAPEPKAERRQRRRRRD